MKKNIVLVVLLALSSGSSLLGVLKELSSADKALLDAENLNDVKNALGSGADVNLEVTEGNAIADLFNSWLYDYFSFNENQPIEKLKEVLKSGLIIHEEDWKETVDALEFLDELESLTDFLKEIVGYSSSSNKIEFFKTLKNPDYDLYLHLAINAGNSTVVRYILEQIKETPLYALNLIAGNKRLPETLVTYLLDQIRPTVKDLVFLSKKDVKQDGLTTDKGKALFDIYELAKTNNRKRLGKAILDYYTNLRLITGQLQKSKEKLFPEDIGQNIVGYQEN